MVGSLQLEAGLGCPLSPRTVCHHSGPLCSSMCLSLVLGHVGFFCVVCLFVFFEGGGGHLIWVGWGEPLVVVQFH